MILIGMFDSPYVRRVAISLRLLGWRFEHRNWSVGSDFDQIRRYNPLGRVPTLVLDDGASLIDSAAILDWIDEQAGAERALLPASGAPRRQALQLMAIATGTADKGVAQLYEQAFRPAERRHEPWVARCHTQMLQGLAELERACAGRSADWLLGARMTQADITVSVVATFVFEALRPDLSRYSALDTLRQRAEALPAFYEFHQPFFAPQPGQG